MLIVRRSAIIRSYGKEKYEKEFYLVNPQTGRFSQEGFKTKGVKPMKPLEGIMERPEMEVAPVELNVVSKSVPKTYVNCICRCKRVLQEKTPNPL